MLKHIIPAGTWCISGRCISGRCIGRLSTSTNKCSMTIKQQKHLSLPHLPCFSFELLSAQVQHAGVVQGDAAVAKGSPSECQATDRPGRPGARLAGGPALSHVLPRQPQDCSSGTTHCFLLLLGNLHSQHWCSPAAALDVIGVLAKVKALFMSCSRYTACVMCPSSKEAHMRNRAHRACTNCLCNDQVTLLFVISSLSCQQT